MNEKGSENVMEIGQKLMDLEDFMAAGELFLLGNFPKQAVNALISAQEWAKAKRVNFLIFFLINFYFRWLVNCIRNWNLMSTNVIENF